MDGALWAYLPFQSLEVEGDRSAQTNSEESLVEGISEAPPSPEPKWMPEPARLLRGELPVESQWRTRKVLYHQVPCDGSEASQSPDRTFIGNTWSEASPVADRTSMLPDMREIIPYIGSPEPNEGSASSSSGNALSPLSLDSPSSGPSREATGPLVEEPEEVDIAHGLAQPPEAAHLPMPFVSPPPAGGHCDLDTSTGDKLTCPRDANRVNESVSKSAGSSSSEGSATQATGSLRITPGSQHFCRRGTRLLLDDLARFRQKHNVKASASFTHREVTVEAYDRCTQAAKLELATLFADHFPLAKMPECLQIDGYVMPMRLDLADREATTFMDLLDKYSEDSEEEEGRESAETYSLDEIRQYWVLRMGIIEHGALTDETRLQFEDSEAECDSPCKVLVYDGNRSETEGLPLEPMSQLESDVGTHVGESSLAGGESALGGGPCVDLGSKFEEASINELAMEMTPQTGEDFALQGLFSPDAVSVGTGSLASVEAYTVLAGMVVDEVDQTLSSALSTDGAATVQPTGAGIEEVDRAEAVMSAGGVEAKEDCDANSIVNSADGRSGVTSLEDAEVAFCTFLSVLRNAETDGSADGGSKRGSPVEESEAAFYALQAVHAAALQRAQSASPVCGDTDDLALCTFQATHAATMERVRSASPDVEALNLPSEELSYSAFQAAQAELKSQSEQPGPLLEPVAAKDADADADSSSAVRNAAASEDGAASKLSQHSSVVGMVSAGSSAEDSAVADANMFLVVDSVVACSQAALNSMTQAEEPGPSLEPIAAKGADADAGSSSTVHNAAAREDGAASKLSQHSSIVGMVSVGSNAGDSSVADANTFLVVDSVLACSQAALSSITQAVAREDGAASKLSQHSSEVAGMVSLGSGAGESAVAYANAFLAIDSNLPAASQVLQASRRLAYDIDVLSVQFQGWTNESERKVEAEKAFVSTPCRRAPRKRADAAIDGVTTCSI